MFKHIALFLLITCNVAFAQEWKSLKAYRKETGNTALAEGNWLKKDRKKNTATWQRTNKFNLSQEDGYHKYKTPEQIRDFYIWFDAERKKLGHEIEWFGVTAIVEDQFSKLDAWFVRTFIVSNKEVRNFAHEGSKNAFEYSFPQMKSIYFSKDMLKGKDAYAWDVKHGTGEQCKILEPLYKKLSPKALKKLDNIARRKGLYWIGIPKALEYEGKLDDCWARTEYGLKKLIPYYRAKTKKSFALVVPITP